MIFYTDMSPDTNHNTQNPQNSLQPVIYGVLPDQSNGEINLGDLFSKLINQWKLILGFTLGGTVLAVLLALLLPSVYQPSVTVSVPLAGNVASVVTTNALLSEEEGELLSTPQMVFANYFNLFRSDMILAEYVHEKKYLGKLYPDTTKSESVLLAKLLDGLSVIIEEPTPEKKGAYIASPVRVRISLDVEDEAIGVDLLNGYANYVNQKLITNLQNDTRETINNKIEILSKQVARQREQYTQDRILTIQKIEQENAKEIAVLEEQISAYLEKSRSKQGNPNSQCKRSFRYGKKP